MIVRAEPEMIGCQGCGEVDEAVRFVVVDPINNRDVQTYWQYPSGWLHLQGPPRLSVCSHVCMQHYGAQTASKQQ